MPRRPLLLFGISRRLQISSEVPRALDDFSTLRQPLGLELAQSTGDIIGPESNRQRRRIIGRF